MADLAKVDAATDEFVPFRLSKEDALAAYKDFKHGKIFAPSIFRKQSHIDEIEPVYMPVWSFEGKVSADARYTGIKTRKYTEMLDGRETDVLENVYHDVARKGDVRFSDVLVLANDEVPEDQFEYMYPYDLSEATPVSQGEGGTPVQGGRFVECSRSVESAAAAAGEQTKKFADDLVAKTVVGYNESGKEDATYTPVCEKAKRVWLPVWLLTTDWNGKKYQFVMNGQTGKPKGELPVALSKVVGSLIFLFALTFLFVIYSDMTSWHIVGMPAHVVMYLILPCFVSGALTLSYYNQIKMVNSPKPPIPHEPNFDLVLTSSSDEAVRTETTENKKSGRMQLGGTSFRL